MSAFTEVVVRLIPFLVADLLRRLETGLVGGVVYENVDATEGTDGLLHNGTTVRRI